jgi:murein DD-endopeptidase MepM/ murein hydrolase activator NlpD
MRRLIAVIAILTAVLAGTTAPARAGEWLWPVIGPVMHGFDPPTSPYGTGHRGLDIVAAPGTSVIAPAPGRVSFAGPVAGELFVSIDHGHHVMSTYAWVSRVLVDRGEAVAPGQAIALSGAGHVGGDVTHVHMGVRVGGVYVDPLEYLPATSITHLIRLAPIAAPG